MSICRRQLHFCRDRKYYHFLHRNCPPQQYKSNETPVNQPIRIRNSTQGRPMPQWWSQGVVWPLPRSQDFRGLWTQYPAYQNPVFKLTGGWLKKPLHKFLFPKLWSVAQFQLRQREFEPATSLSRRKRRNLRLILTRKRLKWILQW